MAWEEISQGMQAMTTGLQLWRDLRQTFPGGDGDTPPIQCETNGCRNDARYCAICYEAAGKMKVSNINIVRGGRR